MEFIQSKARCGYALFLPDTTIRAAELIVDGLAVLLDSCILIFSNMKNNIIAVLAFGLGVVVGFSFVATGSEM